MPFKRVPIAPSVKSDVISERIVSAFNDSGQLVTKIVSINECTKESVDYREYSLRNQLNSGDTIKQVRTDLLGDDFDSITTDMVKPYFEENVSNVGNYESENS